MIEDIHSARLRVRRDVRIPKGFCKNNKRPCFLCRAQWQSVVWQLRNSLCCITLLMLLKWPRRFSAWEEGTSDHLLLFLEKPCMTLRHRTFCFLSAMWNTCKGRMLQLQVMFLRFDKYAQGQNKNRCWRDCLPAGHFYSSWQPLWQRFLWNWEVEKWGNFRWNTETQINILQWKTH